MKLLIFGLGMWLNFGEYSTLEACRVDQSMIIKHDAITEALCCDEERCYGHTE